MGRFFCFPACLVNHFVDNNETTGVSRTNANGSTRISFALVLMNCESSEYQANTLGFLFLSSFPLKERVVCSKVHTVLVSLAWCLSRC